ncbi:MAG: hypothetical protein ABI634_14040 [Acidobacteriota bacterium]
MTTSVAGVASITNAKRGLKALLLGEAYLQALAQVSGEFGDGLPMSPLATVRTTEKKTLETLPLAEIHGLSSVRLGDSQWSRSRLHTLAVRFYVGGSVEETITDQVERYVLAVRRMFEGPGDEARLFPMMAGTVDVDDEDYDPIRVRENAEPTLVKTATVILLVRTVN